MHVEETMGNVFKSMLLISILRPLCWFQKGIDKEVVTTKEGQVFWLVHLGSKRAAHLKDLNLCQPIGLVRVPWGPDGVVLCGPEVKNKGVIYHNLGLLVDEDPQRSVNSIGAKLRADSFAVDSGYREPLVAALRDELRLAEKHLKESADEAEKEMLKHQICNLEMRLAYL